MPQWRVESAGLTDIGGERQVGAGPPRHTHARTAQASDTTQHTVARTYVRTDRRTDVRERCIVYVAYATLIKTMRDCTRARGGGRRRRRTSATDI
jgi:hypothetical protein